MSDEISFEGSLYISASDAAASAGFTRDYIARLCRAGKLLGRRVGKNWYVEKASYEYFLVLREYEKGLRRESLSEERRHEYQRKTISSAPVAQHDFEKKPVSIVESVAEKTSRTIIKAPRLLGAPSGLAHAAASLPAHTGIHASINGISPVLELFHKIIATMFSLMMVFSMLSLFDPNFSRFAFQEIKENTIALNERATSVVFVGAASFVNKIQTSMIAVGNDPRASSGRFKNQLALAVRSDVDSLKTALSNTFSLVAFSESSLGRGLSRLMGVTTGSVAIDVLPYTQQTSIVVGDTYGQLTESRTATTSELVLGSSTTIPGPRRRDCVTDDCLTASRTNVSKNPRSSGVAIQEASEPDPLVSSSTVSQNDILTADVRAFATTSLLSFDRRDMLSAVMSGSIRRSRLALATSNQNGTTSRAHLIQLTAAAFPGVASLGDGVDQGDSSDLIATAVAFNGSNVAYGDIVSFDATANAFVLTHISNDPHVYGVVVEDPALLFKSDTVDTYVPVVRTGLVLVNVTLENGPISTGDPLTSSSVPGKARRANPDEHAFGMATEPLTEANAVTFRGVDGKEILSGTIATNLNVVGGRTENPTPPSCTSLACRLLNLVNPDVALGVTRFTLAGVIAALSLIFAFRSFMSAANFGVISMGRNPSAKSSIRALVFFNAMSALAIAGAGLFAAVFVLFVGS